MLDRLRVRLLPVFGLLLASCLLISPRPAHAQFPEGENKWTVIDVTNAINRAIDGSNAGAELREKLVRRFSSEDKPEPVAEKDLDIPTFWIRPPQVLSASSATAHVCLRKSLPNYAPDPTARRMRRAAYSLARSELDIRCRRVFRIPRRRRSRSSP